MRSKNYPSFIRRFYKILEPLLAPIDRRTRFDDPSSFPVDHRVCLSHCLQIYSSIHNIGNYTPVFGMHEMLCTTPVMWSIHHPIDWVWVNSNFKCVIIGGAGLFHRNFTPVWRRLLDECKLPIIIWGVGVCDSQSEPIQVEDRQVLRNLAARCDLINVRDEMTANLLEINDIDIAPCPTNVWLRKFNREASRQKGALFASHDEMVPRDMTRSILSVLRKRYPRLAVTDNIQRPWAGIEDIIQSLYLPKSIVVSTRLHGVIFARGLGIPYLGIAFDKKMIGFDRVHGGGEVIERLEGVEELLGEIESQNPGRPDLTGCLEFGKRASAWVQTHL